MTEQTAGTIDQAKAEAFMGKMVGFLNGASMGFMLSIGHRTGLFDTLAGLPPATSEDIAKAAGLNERYVREWLGAVVTGGIVDYNPVAHTYSLPPEHAGALTRAAGPNNLARIAQQFAIFGSVESQLVDCFRQGGAGSSTPSTRASTRSSVRLLARSSMPPSSRGPCPSSPAFLTDSRRASTSRTSAAGPGTRST